MGFRPIPVRPQSPFSFHLTSHFSQGVQFGSTVLAEVVIGKTLGLQLSIFIPKGKGCPFLHKDHFSSEQVVDGICRNVGINRSVQLPRV